MARKLQLKKTLAQRKIDQNLRWDSNFEGRN
jgi:hypothetical protein